jgi:predicted MFS family arabinose efflux permease
MVCSASGCILGGHLSDKLGRRLMLATYVLLTTVPTIAFAWWMHRQGWIFPIDPKAATKPIPPPALITGFLIALLTFSFVHGLMYGARTALFMDLCTPALAATQFTVYMSLLNLGMSYSAFLTGLLIKKLGYPTTLLLDAAFGCLCLLLMPLLRNPPPDIPFAKLAPVDRGLVEYQTQP